ncbi:hypothetical protein [Pandoraea terrigena]|uniref:Uncharacterized protein n=1 Tax=Pandoraea terrigena TaxID=2508292 RepID=A0A5E4V5R8_9BURK|nr:hypothetical protein [Pandoraea terrigena]VVE06894.1 hypothetical protein PTE31013_02436 [Pandoraea terrigena]
MNASIDVRRYNGYKVVTIEIGQAKHELEFLDVRESRELSDTLLTAAADLVPDRPSYEKLVETLERAHEFIDSIRQELHSRRVADWYPEGAHNAAEQMSEDMRILGNDCADFDIQDVIAKARGEA